MKLFATLETSTGKKVSISDNEQIIATVYDKNMRAYSVIIEWCSVGDPTHIRCNKCGWEVDEAELGRVCPNCKTTEYLKETEEIMGAIITTREWRDQPDDRRKVQRKA